MALTGPPLALNMNPEEDVDFFDQLAQDLGQGEGLHQDCYKGEVEFGEDFSKLSMSDKDAAAAAYIQDTSGSIENERWMQERVCNEGSLVNPALCTISGLVEATQDMLEADPASHLNTSALDASITDRILSGNASTPTVTPVEENDVQECADFNPKSTFGDGSEFEPSHGAVENQDAEPTTIPSDNSLTLQSDPVPFDDPHAFQSNLKELQWSSFSEIYTQGEGSDSLNDLLSELDVRRGALVDQSFGYQIAGQADSHISTPPTDSNSPFKLTAENGNVLTNSNVPFEWKAEHGNGAEHNIFSASLSLGADNAGTQLHGNGTYANLNQLETHQSQVFSDNSVSFSHYGTSKHPQGEPGINQGGENMAVTAGAAFGNHNVEAVSFSQQYEDGQLHGGSYTINGSLEAHQQANAQESWESMYPGWYFDYTSNEWKQIEGWDSSHSDVNQTAGLQTELGQSLSSTSGFTNAMDVSGSASHEHTAYTGPTRQESSSGFYGEGQSLDFSQQADLGGGYEQRNFSGDVQSQAQIPWEEQYPGWYFDYQTQQWQQVAADSNHSLLHSHSGAIETSQVAGDLAMQPELQQETAKNVYWQEEGNVARDFVGDKVTNDQSFSLRGWGSSAVATTVSNSVGATTASNSGGVSAENAKEAFHFESNGSGYGPQSYSNQNLSFYGWESSAVTTTPSDSIGVSTENVKEAFHFESNGPGYGPQSYSDQNLSFHGWGSSAVAMTPSDFVGASTEKVKEAFHFESNGSGYGLESYTTGVSQLYAQPEAQGTLGNKLSSNFYSPYQSNQPHNIHGPTVGTKHYTIERPSHPLVAFGFGGKLVTMKASSSTIPETIVLHDLNQLVVAAENSGQNDGVSYFSSLHRGGLTGPLVGGGIATKDLLKWVDDRIANCDSYEFHSTSAEALRVLWGVLRIACLHYGKLRSVQGSTSIKSQSEEGPELDLGRLLSTASSQSHHNPSITSPAGSQSALSEHQLQALLLEMKIHLMNGKRKEALQLAQQGHLWGPALVLAWHLGEKAYAETILQMAQQQFVPGSPLRTLFLLFGGRTVELFTTKSLPSSVVVAGPDSHGLQSSIKDNAGGMLGDWMGNLSIIAANPTNGDAQVITHLGDCLWKDHGEVAGAHTCYLVADASFEPFSENARLCLVGADHFKWQRTFATPTSIQRTELYEYAKTLGNSQFIALPFQPYKLLYAYMLVEAGKVSEARRYCQAVTKTLRSAGRAPEIELCRQSASALEERLRLHSQGGYSLNSATGKLVGRFIGTLDSTLHKIIGTTPQRQASEPSLNKNPRDWYSSDQSVDSSAKITKASMLDQTAQTENLSRSNSRQMEAPPRSVSEPNLSWSPVKNEDSSETDGGSSKETKLEPGRPGYLGRFGSQLFSKAIGLMKPNKTKANLGDQNKFYYDKNLKKWVEEGAEQTVENIALPPPPISAGFKSNDGRVVHDAHSGANIEGSDGFAGSRLSSSTEIPPLPPSGNQFSARGRLQGVRSRYVDTFNKGGSLPAKSASLPLVPSTGWGTSPPPTQFFMPAHTATPDFGTEASEERLPEKSNSMSASTTPENWQIQPEKGSLLPKDLLSSFTSGPYMQNHSSLPNGNRTELDKNMTEMKLDANIYAAQDGQPLPAPPIIEPALSFGAFENGLYGKSDGPLLSRFPGSEQGGILTDMQEVEL